MHTKSDDYHLAFEMSNLPAERDNSGMILCTGSLEESNSLAIMVDAHFVSILTECSQNLTRPLYAQPFFLLLA